MTLASRFSASRRLVVGARTAAHSWRHVGQTAPLPRLADICPGALRASGRCRGLATTPVGCIVGTASYPHGSRRRDFLPARGHEPANLISRWDRLLSSIDEQAVLPPIDLVRTVDGHWIIDGLNRVALARAMGQMWIGADVLEIGHVGPQDGNYA